MDFYFFPEIRYPRLGKGEKEGLCAFVGILKNFSPYSVLFQINNNSFPFHQSLALRDVFPLAVGKVNLVWGRDPGEKGGVFYIVRPPPWSVL